MQYKIDSCVSITTGERGRKSKYPFGDMQVGDSILFEKENTTLCPAYVSAMNYGKRHGKKFKGSSTTEGLRIWRIE